MDQSVINLIVINIQKHTAIQIAHNTINLIYSP